MSEDGDPASAVMLHEDEVAEGGSMTTGVHGEMPFRLRDFEPFFSFGNIHPIARPLDTIQCELKFQVRLALHEWERGHWFTIALGAVAFLLGSLSPEIISGGDPRVIGAEGIQAISGFAFLQILISFIIWGWFAIQIWSKFPIMRTHAISLLVFWNLFVLAQVLYHKANPAFPRDIVLSDTMIGTLIVLVVLFFIYFFWKAVTETRDMHIEEYHLHEDVRLMEMEMAEHSLRSWGFLLVTWTAMTMLSAWAGAHYIADRIGGDATVLALHIVSGLLTLPVFMMVIWYPQRMLGQDTVVRTKAAIAADAELAKAGNSGHSQSGSFCPECEAEVMVTRNAKGDLLVPCPTKACTTNTMVGKACPTCKVPAPTRYDCPSCGINAPVLDFLSDVEAW